MKASSDHILTSHAGSLPRPDELIAETALFESGRPVLIVPYIQKTGLELGNNSRFGTPGPDSAGKFAQCRSSRHGGVTLDYRVTLGPNGNLNSGRRGYR